MQNTQQTNQKAKRKVSSTAMAHIKRSIASYKANNTRFVNTLPEGKAKQTTISKFREWIHKKEQMLIDDALDRIMLLFNQILKQNKELERVQKEQERLQKEIEELTAHADHSVK